MSDANLQVGIESGEAVSGSRTVVRSLNDIYSAANTLDSKLKAMESTLGRVGSNPGLTQAKAAIQSLQSPLQSFKAELERIESRIIRIGVTAVALGVVNTIFGRIRETLTGAIKAVDDFQISVISIAASLTQIRIANGETDLAKAYQVSSMYAGQLALKLQEVDKLSFANYKGLMAMLQVMTAQGQVLDINNKKQVDAFTNLSNAIAIMTPGQDQQMQMYQETRAIMTGIADRYSQVARMLDQQIKSQGIYKGGLKEVAELGRRYGDTIERIAPYLQGIGAASGDISKTWSTVVATFDTVLNFVQRMSFGPVVKDLTTMVSLFSELVRSNSPAITASIQHAWGFIKEAVLTIDEKTGQIKFSSEFLNSLKLASDLTKGVIDSFAILTKWAITYSEELKTLVQVYLAYKTITIVSTQLNKLLGISYSDATANLLAKQVAMARLGITESSYLTIQQESLLASREALLVSAQEATNRATQQAARQAEIALINSSAQAKIKDSAQTIENIQVRRWEIGLEQEANASKISTLRLNADLLVQERLLAESRASSALAYANASIAANGRAWSSEAIAIEKTERDLLSAAIGRETQARMALESTMITLAGLEAEEISLKASQTVAQEALLNAKIHAVEVDSAATSAAVRYNAALLALGETTGFVTAASLAKVQTDYLRLVEQDRLTGSTLAAVAVENAHSEALAMNTVSVRANALGHVALTEATLATTGAAKALSTVWNLMGGWIGAVIIAVYGLYTAYKELNEMEEKYERDRAKRNGETYTSSLRQRTEDLKKQIKDLSATPETIKQDAVDEYAKGIQETQSKLDSAKQSMQEFTAAHKHEMESIVDGTSIKRALVYQYKEIKDEIDRQTESTVNAKKEFDEYSKTLDKYSEVQGKMMKGFKGTGKALPDKNEESEAQKALNKLITGYEHWQQVAIRTGKVEDELASKIEGHQTAVANLLKDTAKAKGPQADSMRASINALLAETIAIEINLDWKKKRFETLATMQEKEETVNEQTLRNSQILHAKGIIDDQQYVDAQLIFKQNELDIQKRYLEQKLQVMQDLNINTKDRQEVLLALEKNKNAQLAVADNAELTRMSEVSRRKAVERQRELDDVQRKSDEFRSILSLDVSRGNISSSESANLELYNEIKVLEQRREILQKQAFSGGTVSEMQQVWQEIAKVDSQITIVQNKAKSFAADQGWVEGIKRGFKQYADDAVNLGKQMESAVTNAMKGMEDALVNFVKTGKMNFKDMADAIISDLIRIAIRTSITGPIASAIGGINWGGMFGFANGGVFESGVQKFAKGGVVSSPTIFPMAKGAGLMGEAGPEAIMPLTRTPSGKLGVETTGGGQDSEFNVEININNKSGGEVKQGSTNWQFDGKKFIINTIIEDVSNNGPLRGLMSAQGG